MRDSAWKSCLAIGLATAFVYLGPGASIATAGSMTTEVLRETTPIAVSHSDGRERLHDVLDRPEVIAQLADLGVSAGEAHRRIDALSDAEVAALNGHLDTLPAGGWVGAVVGAILIVFLVLLFTDLIGATDVFPWVRKR